MIPKTSWALRLLVPYTHPMPNYLLILDCYVSNDGGVTIVVDQSDEFDDFITDYMIDHLPAGYTLVEFDWCEKGSSAASIIIKTKKTLGVAHDAMQNLFDAFYNTIYDNNYTACVNYMEITTRGC